MLVIESQIKNPQQKKRVEAQTECWSFLRAPSLIISLTTKILFLFHDVFTNTAEQKILVRRNWTWSKNVFCILSFTPPVFSLLKKGAYEK